MMANEKKLSDAIKREAAGMPLMRFMEVCGTHTVSIKRNAIEELLPSNIKLVSGPGCPVCVTSQTDIGLAIQLAEKQNITFFTYGDMMRVPCGGKSLYDIKGAENDIRFVMSALDIIKAAESQPERDMVFFAVGFETTTPATATLILEAEKRRLNNISVLCRHKTMPQAIREVLKGDTQINGLICPGHVAVITGAEAFRFVPEEYDLPAAVSGFSPDHILLAVLSLVRMIRNGKPNLENCYPGAVSAEGNLRAKDMIGRVFTECDAEWRGLGVLRKSGLSIKEKYSDFDAEKKYILKNVIFSEPKGCSCGKVLKGIMEPEDCPLFGGLCTPATPIGPCMVSTEGACSASYLYRNKK
jgi:hydrogenase expression/formation protein HypD